MRLASAIIATDSPSRDGIRLATQVLFRMLVDRYSQGMPQLVMHDAHRPVGWAFPDKLLLGPEMVRLHATIEFPENEDERVRVSAAYNDYVAGRQRKVPESSMKRLRSLVEPYLQGAERQGFQGACLIEPDLARRVASDVFATEDKSGLVPLRSLTPIAPGVFSKGDVILFADAGFRRTLSRLNSLNGSLLEQLEVLSKSDKVTVRLRLDADMVGLRDHITDAVEWAYWFGPKFNDALETIPTGLTVHEADDRQRFYNSVSRTEFWWQSRDGLHTFEAEELRDRPTHANDEERYGCRYVHSIVQEDTKQIIHLDGAIREYTGDGFLARLDAKITDAGRSSHYTKLWRVDGEIPLSSWKVLVHHHFRDNDLVAEYLEPDCGHRSVFLGERPTPEAHEPRIVVRTPALQVQLSVRDKCLVPAPRILGPLSSFSSGDDRTEYVELCVVELAKVLRRDGAELEIQSTARRVHFHDLYSNFPLIRHSSGEHAAVTIAAFSTLLGKWSARGEDDRRVSLAVAVPIGEREITLSAAGTPTRVLALLRSTNALLQCLDDQQVADWVAAEAKELRQDQGTMECIGLKERGLWFVFDRPIINPGDVRSERGSVVVSSEAVLRDFLDSKIRPETAHLVVGSTCSRCDCSYESCPCCSAVDEIVQDLATEPGPAFFYWTDRSAALMELQATSAGDPTSEGHLPK